MTRNLYYGFFYRHSIPEILLWGVLLTVFWTALALVSTRISLKSAKAWIWANRALLIFSVFIILWRTLLNRTPGAEHKISLIPFHSFMVALTSSERARSVAANILLFIPFGLSMPFVMDSGPKKDKWRTRHPVLVTLLFAALLSLFIEFAQYLFALGLCETDDVGANLTGAALGSLSFVVCKKKYRFGGRPFS